jgi:hypothetical protein
MATFYTENFNYNPNTKLFTADMSTLDKGGTRQVFHRVYKDSMDAGFVMISTHTGVEITFVVDKIDHGGKENEGEIAGWHLIPTKQCKRNHPCCVDLKVLIVNT